MSSNEVETFIRRNPQFDYFDANNIRQYPELVNHIQRFFRRYPQYNVNSPNFNLNNFTDSIFLNEDIIADISRMDIQSNIDNIREIMHSLIHNPIQSMLTEAQYNGNTNNNNYDYDENNTQREAIELQHYIFEPREYINKSDVELQQQITRIETFLRNNPNLDDIFLNTFNEDLANAKAELERRHPITGQAAANRRAETARQIEAMRANTARLVKKAKEEKEVKEENSVFGECSICYEPINYGDEAVDAHDINSKKSGHIFHKDCIMKICNNTIAKKECPECRAPLLCEEIQQGSRDVNTNLGLQGGKRRQSKKRKSKKRKNVKRRLTKRRKGKKY